LDKGGWDFEPIDLSGRSYFEEPKRSKHKVEKDYFDEYASEEDADEEEERSQSGEVNNMQLIVKPKSVFEVDKEDVKFDHALHVVERESGLLGFFKSWRTDVQVPFDHCTSSGADAEVFKRTYTKACKGSKSAQCELGIMYYYANHSVLQSTKSAIYWLKLAGNRKYRLAMINLGIIYYFKEDFEEAHEWFLRAAEDGCPWGMFHLGVMYYNGEGAYHNVYEAFSWFKRSGKHGNALAQNNVGAMYADGSGCVKNVKKAMKWFEKSAEGCAYALHNLGMMFEKGIFVNRDPYEASRYFGMARSGHHGYNYGPGVNSNLHKRCLRDNALLMITSHNF